MCVCVLSESKDVTIDAGSKTQDVHELPLMEDSETRTTLRTLLGPETSPIAVCCSDFPIGEVVHVRPLGALLPRCHHYESRKRHHGKEGQWVAEPLWLKKTWRAQLQRQADDS